MFGVVARAGCLTSATKATSSLLPKLGNSALPSTVVVSVPKQSDPISSEIVRVSQSGGGFDQTCARNSLFGAQQLRYAHTDFLHDANFERFQRNASHQKSSDTDVRTKQFTYLVGGAATALPLVIGAKNAVITFVSTLDLSKDILAMAQSEVDLSTIPEGKTAMISWRGKPLFVRHRTPAEIETEGEVGMGELRDPQADHERSKKPEWVVVVGICTHLGCVPLSNQGKFGGFFCPCHGSHYDTSGRIRVGPAPLNLEVPPHDFVSDELLVVG